MLYRELQRILAEDVPALPLYHPVYAYAIAKRVQNVRVGPLQDYPIASAPSAQWYINTAPGHRQRSPAVAEEVEGDG